MKSRKGSENEKQDIRHAYIDCRGAINAIMVNVPFLCSSDKSRVSAVIEGTKAIYANVTNCSYSIFR